MPTTPEQRQILLQDVADGKSLVQACKDNSITRSVVYEDLAEDKAFADSYARACEIRADAVFDDLFEIADDGTNDWMERHDSEGGNIGWKENGEALGRSKLRVDARKWALARMNPKKYGDKVAVGGADDLPPIQVALNDVELARRVAFVLHAGLQKGSSNGESGLPSD